MTPCLVITNEPVISKTQSFHSSCLWVDKFEEKKSFYFAQNQPRTLILKMRLLYSMPYNVPRRKLYFAPLSEKRQKLKWVPFTAKRFEKYVKSWMKIKCNNNKIKSMKNNECNSWQENHIFLFLLQTTRTSQLKLEIQFCLDFKEWIL